MNLSSPSYFRHILLCAFLFSLGFQAAKAQPTQPILRIEAETHTAHISELSVDRANRFLVTASYDKTARVWDLTTGKLTQILRPPIADSHEGKLYCVAISPDGETIAVGGWTGWDFTKRGSIYLFDRESGRMKHIIKDLPDLIHALVFSSDGRFLATGLDRNKGIRLFETGEYRQVAADQNYTERVYTIDFDPTNQRLVTGDEAGVIRLYHINADGTLKLSARNFTTEKKPVFGLKFSPGGDRVAASFLELRAVAVFSGYDLAHQYTPDSTDLRSGYFNGITWSPDGRRLLAGGHYIKEGKSMIRVWRDEGRGRFKDVGVSEHSIFQLIPLPSGGVAYCTAGDWGILDSDGDLKSHVDSPLADFRNMGKGLLLSPDGSEVFYQYNIFEQNRAKFSLQGRNLEVGGSKKGLNPAVIKADGLDVTGWNETYEPAVNGKRIKFYYQEKSRSLAILPDGERFVLGTDHHLRLLNSRAQIIWRLPMADTVWSVNATENGKFAVVAVADGTIRWFRVADGKELLAFFPHKDRRRWILWTPSGYYDASPGAEDLIGWHVNNGKDSPADFFPNHLFRAQFYRPDVIDLILQTADEISAVKLANEKAGKTETPLTIAEILPPVIEINEEKVKEIANSNVNITYNIRNHSKQEITAIKAIIDGREISPSKVTKQKDGSIKVSLEVPKRDSELSLIAENRFTKSLPAKIYLKWRGQ